MITKETHIHKNLGQRSYRNAQRWAGVDGGNESFQICHGAQMMQLKSNQGCAEPSCAGCVGSDSDKKLLPSQMIS